MKTPQMLDCLHVTTAHHPLDTRITQKELISLRDRGLRVGLVAPWTTGLDTLPDGIDFTFVPKPRSRMGRFLSLAPRLFLKALKTPARLVHFHDPDFLPFAILLKAFGRKVVYDIHEDYPLAILSRSYLPRAIRPVVASFLKGMEKLAASVLDGFVCADVQLEPRFPADRRATVRNYILIREWPYIPPAKQASSILRGLYVGEITEARGLFSMLDAVLHANRQGLPAFLDLVGPMSKTLRDKVEAHPARPYAHVHGRLGRAAVQQRMMEADFGFCLLHPTPAYVSALPVKILEYLANGLPVLASDLPRLRAEQKDLKGLHLCDPLDPASAVTSMQALRSAPPSQEQRLEFRTVVEQRYNWNHEADKLFGFIGKLLAESGADRH